MTVLAPGTKMTVIADRMGRKGELVGVDISPKRSSTAVNVTKVR